MMKLIEILNWIRCLQWHEMSCEICGDWSKGCMTCEDCFYDQDGEPRYKGL